MQTRSTSKRSICLPESSKAATAPAVMDPDLWSTLPRELVLKVYTSLEIKELYQLRAVCKGWNREACSLGCFTDPIPRPYFVVIQHSEKHPQMRIIGYKISSGTWMTRFLPVRGGTVPNVLAFHRFDPIGDIMEPFTVEGILFGKGCLHRCECFHPPKHVFLFDIQVNHTILDFVTFGPFGSLTNAGQDRSAIGLMVDTTTKPHAVKLIVGTPNASTLVLDSETRAWKMYSSQMIRNRRRGCPKYTPKSCISCDGKMYIWGDLDEIQVYTAAEDRWSTLDPPLRHPHHADSCRGLGHWQNEVYAVTRTGDLSPTVWRLAPSHASWEEFELMPPAVWEYMAKPSARIPPRTKILIVQHCGVFLLMYIKYTHESTPKKGPRKPPRRHVLFSLANKRWETMDFETSGGCYRS